MAATMSNSNERIKEKYYSTSSALFSISSRTWSNLVVNKLRAVSIPPFGPRLYLWIMICGWGRLPEDQDILLHDLLVIDCVSDVNVGFKGNMGHCGIEVQDIGRSRVVLGVQIGIDTLHKGRFSSTGHANGDDQTRFSRPWVGHDGCPLRKATRYTNTNNSFALTSTAIWTRSSTEHTEVVELRPTTTAEGGSFTETGSGLQMASPCALAQPLYTPASTARGGNVVATEEAEVEVGDRGESPPIPR